MYVFIGQKYYFFFHVYLLLIYFFEFLFLSISQFIKFLKHRINTSIYLNTNLLLCIFIHFPNDPQINLMIAFLFSDSFNYFIYYSANFLHIYLIMYVL